jgi:D-3-phosphoglycerate dehydrogenase
VGLDNVDVGEAEKRGINVINSPEAPSNAVAELVAGFILSLVRMIPRADHSLKRGEWLKRELLGFEVNEKTLGIVGFGRIGYNLAKKMNGMGMRIIAYDIKPERVEKYVDQVGGKLVSMEELLEHSDFVTLHVPLTPETYHLLSGEEFNKMKKSSYLINTSRGGIIDEAALVEALDSGKLAGAALDVFEHEPPRNTSLVGREDVISTPHIGASTQEAQLANSVIIAEKLIKLFG